MLFAGENAVFLVMAFAYFLLYLPFLMVFYEPKRIGHKLWRERRKYETSSTLCPSCAYLITVNDLDEDENFVCPECGSRNTFWLADHAWRSVLKLPEDDQSSESAATS